MEHSLRWYKFIVLFICSHNHANDFQVRLPEEMLDPDEYVIANSEKYGPLPYIIF